MTASIARIGSEKSYDQFKKEFTGKSVNFAHEASHLFGETMFKADGLDGIRVCDAAFGFGCYHGYLTTAIAKAGLDKVKQIDDICVSTYGPQGLGCTHGIGHGLGEFLGPSKLSQQLDICATLTWQGRFFGCKEGVFMEYNMPVSVGDDNARLTLREFDPTHPYDPCPRVKAKFQPACYMEISNWWEEQLKKDYGKMGLLCNGIPEADNKEACFIGVGYSEGPKDGYNLQRTLAVCALMGNPDGELKCRAGASWSFFANPDHRRESAEVCQYSTPEQTDLCRKKGDLLSYPVL
jgi:hypothetical protein